MHIPSRSVVLSLLLLTLATLSSARPLPSAPSSNPKVSLDPVAAALASKIAGIDKQIGELPVLPGVPSGLKLETATTTQVKIVAPATAVGNPKNKAKTRNHPVPQPWLEDEADDTRAAVPRRAVTFGAPLPSQTPGPSFDRRAVGSNPKHTSAFPTTSKQPIKVASTPVVGNPKHATTTSSEKIFSTPSKTTLKMVPVTFTLSDGTTKVVTRVGGPGHPGEPGGVSATGKNQP
ncbi:hypothetical protein JCM10296v2_005369 [Rhodotorula toruloides]